MKTKTYANIFKKENHIPQARDLQDYLKAQHEHDKKLQRCQHSLDEKKCDNDKTQNSFKLFESLEKNTPTSTKTQNLNANLIFK
jgi:hypothetical protein